MLCAYFRHFSKSLHWSVAVFIHSIRWVAIIDQVETGAVLSFGKPYNWIYNYENFQDLGLLSHESLTGKDYLIQTTSSFFRTCMKGDLFLISFSVISCLQSFNLSAYLITCLISKSYLINVNSFFPASMAFSLIGLAFHFEKWHFFVCRKSAESLRSIK